MTDENMTDEQKMENLKNNLAEIVKEGLMLMMLSRALLRQIATAPDGKLDDKHVAAAKEMLSDSFSDPNNFIVARIAEDALDAMSAMGIDALDAMSAMGIFPDTDSKP